MQDISTSYSTLIDRTAFLIESFDLAPRPQTDDPWQYRLDMAIFVCGLDVAEDTIRWVARAALARVLGEPEPAATSPASGATLRETQARYTSGCLFVHAHRTVAKLAEQKSKRLHACPHCGGTGVLPVDSLCLGLVRIDGPQSGEVSLKGSDDTTR